MKVMHALTWLAAVTAVWMPDPAAAQALIANRFFAGSATLSVYRPGHPATEQAMDIEATFSGYSSAFHISLPGADPFGASYGFFELPQGATSIALMRRDGAANALFPGMMLALGQARPEGNALLAIGWLSGTDAAGPYSGSLLMKLQQPLLVPPTPEPPPTPDPPPPPTPNPNPVLPAFDGTTLRVPADWSIRKFEGWALHLAQKYGTLSGGTSARVPSSWTDGVMQCHGTQGFIYQIPLAMEYQGMVNGSILYTPNGAWPSWEPRDRWHAIAEAEGYTKYVFR